MRHGIDLWRGNFPRSVFDLVNDLERAWGDSNITTQAEKTFRPSADVRENEKAYLLSFDLPGVRQEDIKIDLTDNTLKVTGTRKSEIDESSDRLHKVERYYGRFERSFQFPNLANLDAVEANFENGVLQVVVPKSDASKARAVEVQSEKGSNFFRKFIGTKEEDVNKDNSKH